jgi:septal ring factor EnvC (AmiA/AmiB activator)
VRSLSILHLASAAVLGAAACGTAQEKSVPAQAQQTRQPQMRRDTSDWRAQMQRNQNADSSIEQQVRRLTKDLNLTPQQQVKVRQLSHVHHDRIQQILDTAPPSLTRESFTAQVHVISQQYHDSVNAILTPHQLDLMRAMVGRTGNGQEARRPPP